MSNQPRTQISKGNYEFRLFLICYNKLSIYYKRLSTLSGRLCSLYSWFVGLSVTEKYRTDLHESFTRYVSRLNVGDDTHRMDWW